MVDDSRFSGLILFLCINFNLKGENNEMAPYYTI